MNKKIRVIVCGTTFGKFYIEAIRQNPEIFELVAIFAKGSERSKQCATEYKVPLITEIENIPHDIDLACVVLRSGALGGNGSMLAKSLLKMKISVCCPSYKRPKVETLDYLPFTKVYVDNKEYNDYIKENKPKTFHQAFVSIFSSKTAIIWWLWTMSVILFLENVLNL